MKRRRWLVSLVVVFGLLFESAGAIASAESDVPEPIQAEPVDVPPLEVTGTPKGEELRPQDVPEGVLLEPPSDAVPVEESWNERLEREREAAPSPEVVGFDEQLSDEDE